MFVKKGLLIVLVASTIMLTVGGGSASARLSKLAVVSETDDPLLGGEIVISALDNEQNLPSVAYNWKHDEYLVVWHNTWGGKSDIYAQRITGQGELLSWFAVGPTVPMNPYPNNRIAPSVAYDPVNDRYLVVWLYDTSGNSSNWDVHGVFVNWNGPIPGLHQFNICDWTSQQDMPKVAYSRAEEEFLIVWVSENSLVLAGISGRRMKASDGTFPTSAWDFTISHPTQPRVRPEIAYNLARNEYLVVYDNMQDVFGTRYTGKGLAMAGGEFDIAVWPGAETQPSVAACRETDQYLVAWQNHAPDIYVRFIKGDGSYDGGPLLLENTSIEEIKPQVACNSAGNQFLAVWVQQFSSTTGPFRIYGQFVNTDKTLGPYFGIMSPTSGVSADFTTPVVAGGNVNYLTVWEHDRAGTAFRDIHGRLITPYEVFLPLVLRNH